MSFSLDWEAFYAREAGSFGTYPHMEKLVVLFIRESRRMLELGAGAGGEIPFFVVQNYGYHGIDGSPSTIARLKATYPVVAENLAVADFTKTLHFDGGFDFIVDRASIAHNDLASIRACLALVYEALNPGGLFIGSDWFSTKHSEFVRGRELGERTRDGYADGQFIGAGPVHFTDETELADLFCAFEGVFLQERVVRRCAPGPLMPYGVMNLRWISPHFRNTEYSSAVYDIVVRKPA